MKKIIFVYLFCLGLVYLATPAQAHLNEILNVDLSYEKGLEETIIYKAQDFFNTTKQSIKLDILAGKYAVYFQGDNRSAKQYVLLDPEDYAVTGFYDENLLGRGQEKKSSQQLLEKAEVFLKSLDIEGKDELLYTGVSDGVFDGVYRYTWNRFLDDYLVIGEEFKIDIDARNENIVAWDFSIFDAKKSSINFDDIMPFSKAYNIFTYLDKNSEIIKDFNPILIIRGDKLEWDFFVQSKNTIITLKYYAGVDAHTGEIIYRNDNVGNGGIYPMQYFVPKNYDKIYDFSKNDLKIASAESTKFSIYLNLILFFSFFAIVILVFLLSKKK